MTSSVENQDGQGPIPPEEVVVGYHERTKHHFDRHAASLGYMDWATQPDPFRRYQGSELVRLPMPRLGNPLLYRHLFEPGRVTALPTTLDSGHRGRS